MAGQINRAIGIDRQIGVHLNHAVVVALVPVVACPALVRDVLDDEALLRRQRDARERSGPATVDRRLERRIETIFRNGESGAEVVEAIDRASPHPAAGGRAPVRTASKSASVLTGATASYNAFDSSSKEASVREHRDPGACRRQLLEEVLMAEPRRVPSRAGHADPSRRPPSAV